MAAGRGPSKTMFVGLAVAASVGSLALLIPGVGLMPASPGEPIAAVDVVPGQPFAVDWIADGYPKRAWLDFDCQGCDFPFRGSAQTFVNGVMVGATPIEAWRSQGYAYSSFENGHGVQMHGKFLFDIPALPAWAWVRTVGVFSVPAPDVVWASDGDLRPTAPQFAQLRFWIAN